MFEERKTNKKAKQSVQMLSEIKCNEKVRKRSERIQQSDPFSTKDINKKSYAEAVKSSIKQSDKNVNIDENNEAKLEELIKLGTKHRTRIQEREYKRLMEQRR